MIAKAPHVRLLEKALEVITGLEYEDEAGVAIATVRHRRNRGPNRQERNSIILGFVGDDFQEDDRNRSMAETVRLLTFTLQADIELPTEISNEDPTGLGQASAALRVARAALTAEDGELLEMCDDITNGSYDPSDDAQPDEGRLVRTGVVVYRVRTDDPNELLARSEIP